MSSTPPPLTSRLARQIAEASAALDSIDASFALIGGLALASHRVIRATQDVDFLVDLVKANAIDAEFVRLGYRCLHRSADAANYARADERLDLIYASRAIAKRLLDQAPLLKSALGNIKVVSAEGMIGFKLQALENDPLRTQDREDIRLLLKNNSATLDMSEVRGYFRLFNRETLLDELLR